MPCAAQRQGCQAQGRHGQGRDLDALRRQGQAGGRGDGALDAQGGQLHIEAKRLETAGATLKGGKVKLDVDDVKLTACTRASSYENIELDAAGQPFRHPCRRRRKLTSRRARTITVRASQPARWKERCRTRRSRAVRSRPRIRTCPWRATRASKAAADFAHTEHEKDVRQPSLGAKVGAGGYEAGFSLGSESGLEAHAGAAV